MSSLDSRDVSMGTGFQVKYLGSVSFVRKKRRPLKGIVSLQRPLLDLYTGARRRGEHHRSAHPLALTQQLEVCEYGLVVAEGTTRGETVVTKVITPLSNVVLWASVRFHARIIKKRVLGAAFVPLACSDGVLDPKSYACLSSKQRFLVSLTHPSIFACIYRSVCRPTTFECHAFVCATAEDALAVAACARAPPRHQHRIPPSVVESTTATDYYSPSENEYRDTEEESNSYASVVEKAPPVGRRRFTHHHSRQQKRLLHHQEARALIGKNHQKTRDPPPPQQKAPLSAYNEATNTSVLSSCSPLPQQNGGRPIHEEPETEAEEPPPPPQEEPRFRNSSTMTEATHATEVLAETIDLSSEYSSCSVKSSSVGVGGGWRPVLPVGDTPLVKYTYFGYETYAKTNAASHVIQSRPTPHADGTAKSSIMGSSGRHTGGTGTVIQGNGTGKVTINVPYRPSSRTSSTASSRTTVPHGVRSFHKSGHVRNWSSLSRTSSETSSQQPPPPRSFKVIRWSSEDRLPRGRQQQGGFFFSLKRIGMQSLTKAKHKTGKFISSMKTKIMGPKRSSADGSEDSAYDTSEVCLSPSGRQVSRQPAAKNSAARRQQSWSFHDLRTAAVERPTVRRSHNLVHRRKHRRRRKAGCSSSSSDSGVEAAYHSDNSTRKTGSDFGRNSNRKTGSDLGRNNDNSGVTRVKVQHGMGTDTFQRWSHTNLQDELGYIP